MVLCRASHPPPTHTPRWVDDCCRRQVAFMRRLRAEAAIAKAIAELQADEATAAAAEDELGSAGSDGGNIHAVELERAKASGGSHGPRLDPTF